MTSEDWSFAPGFARRVGSRLLCSSWVGRLVGPRVTAHGCRIDTSIADVRDVDRAYLFWGAYEYPEYRMIRDRLDPAVDVIELGAGIGVISACIAKLLRPGVRLISVEANPRLTGLLEKNLLQNAPEARWSVVNAAVGYSGSPDGCEPFRIRSNPLVSRVESESSASGCSRISGRTLGGILREHDVGDYQLVMDIEGGEWDLFRHDLNSLERCRRIILELHRPATCHPADGLDGLTIRLKEVWEFVPAGRCQNVFVFERSDPGSLRSG